MKQISNKMPESIKDVNAPEWGGYTLDELRYHRAAAFTKKELMRVDLATIAKNAYSSSLPKKGVAGFLIKTVTGRLSVLDYGIMGFRIIRNLISIFVRIKSLFHR